MSDRADYVAIVSASPRPRATSARRQGGTRLSPHRAHPGADVDGHGARLARLRLPRRREAVTSHREPLEQRIRDEARARRVQVAVAVPALAVNIEALRVDQVERI